MNPTMMDAILEMEKAYKTLQRIAIPSPVVKSIASLQKQFEATNIQMILAQQEQLRDCLFSVSSIYNRIFNSDLTRIASYLAELQNQLKICEEPEFLEFYEKYGWLDWLVAGTFMKLYYKHKSGNVTFLQNFCEILYDEKGAKETRNWMLDSSIFLRRERYISKIIQFHTSRDFSASIPLALIQMEGIIRDLAVLKGIIENKENSEYLIDAQGEYIKDKHERPTKGRFGYLVIRLFGEKTQLLHKDVKQPLTKKLKGDIYTHDVRHPILHGTKLDYEDEMLSANLIAVLLSLSHKAREIEPNRVVTPYWETTGR